MIKPSEEVLQKSCITVGVSVRKQDFDSFEKYYKN